MTNISHRNIRHFLAAASLALAVPLTALANPGAPGDCPGMDGRGAPGKRGEAGRAQGGPGEMAPHYLRGLNLSEAQRDKVFEILHAQVPLLRDKAKLAQKSEEELRKLTSSADYSEAKARSLAETISKTTLETTLARAKADRQIFEVLTPEQRKQLAEAKPPVDGPRGPNEPPRGQGPEGRPAPPVR
jgi:Spy/CpxP family protein refolding chaperone